ncbi:hypothetical protein HII31_01845 [Pseudocercospora fuligena]|uniref:Uncharacterized protein n=1 Tax=Pseudocercospora fuligena TaxID=685502 RepID=A0A8H6RU51_9PEZI|nr:hypothetical protein HII31_01845 [Pseudocercospora fuligena]
MQRSNATVSNSHQKDKFNSVRKENERKENEKAKAHYNKFQLQSGDDALMNAGNAPDEDFAFKPLKESLTRQREQRERDDTTMDEPEAEHSEGIPLPSVEAAMNIKAVSLPTDGYPIPDTDFNDLAEVEWQVSITDKLVELCRNDKKFTKANGKAGRFLKEVQTCNKDLKGLANLLRGAKERNTTAASPMNAGAEEEIETRVSGTPQEIFNALDTVMHKFHKGARLQFSISSVSIKYNAAQAEKMVWDLARAMVTASAQKKSTAHPNTQALTMPAAANTQSAIVPYGPEISNWREHLPIYAKAAIDQLLVDLAHHAAQLDTEGVNGFKGYAVSRIRTLNDTLAASPQMEKKLADTMLFEQQLLRTALEIFKISV